MPFRAGAWRLPQGFEAFSTPVSRRSLRDWWPEYLGRKGRCPACKALVDIVAEDSSLVSLTPATRGAARAKVHNISTDVNGLVAAGFGLLATVVLYAVVFFPISGSYLG